SVIDASLKRQNDRTTFAKLRWVKEKHRWVVDKFQALPVAERRKLPESLDVTLSSLYDLIRRQRNDIGHPSDKVPELGRDAAFVYFRLFATFIEDVETFAAYCKKSGI